MEATAPSRTAMGAAMLRAVHHLVDRPPVLEDALAAPLLGVDEARVREAAERGSGPRAVALRAFVAVRSRFAEDCLAEAFARGVRQYVVLGAGLDTSAYRCPLEGLRVFEVDHPATQAWKREQLTRAGIAVPERVRFAPVDFERETLGDGLARAGFELSRPAFLAWLGVTAYLTRDAVVATLRFVAGSCCPGSELVFTFAEPRAGDEPPLRAFAERVAAMGEPLRSTFAPAELAGVLGEAGFARWELADAAALNARYLAGREDGLRIGRGQLMRAWV